MPARGLNRSWPLLLILAGLALPVSGIGCKKPPPPPPPPVEDPNPGFAPQAVQFNSVPSNVLVKLSTGATCTTPCSIVIDRPEPFTATFEKARYRSETVKVNTNVELLREFNSKKGIVVDDSIRKQLPRIYFIPNPVSVTLGGR